jgi:hypothetical protein
MKKQSHNNYAWLSSNSAFCILNSALLTIALWLCAPAASSLFAEELNIKVSANRSQIYIGESFILELTVSGSMGPAEVDFSSIKNATIRPLGTRNVSNFQITIINGRISKEGFTGFVSSYEVTPLSAGKLQVGPISVKIDGKILTDNGPTIEVTDIEKQDRLIILVSSSRETVLIDEPFEISLSLKIKGLPGEASRFEPLVPDHPPALTIPWLDQEMKGLSGPDIRRLLTELLVPHWNQPGVTINNFSLAPDPFDIASMFSHEQRKAKFALPKKITQINNQPYYEYELHFNYLPQDEANYVFGPVICKGEIPVRLDEQMRPVGMNIFAVGPACTVRVIPPPDEGRPESYSGAIGSNMMVKAALDTDKCNVGDPLKLTLTISGQVKLDKILPPKLSLQTNILQNFTVYDNTAQSVKKGSYNQYIYTIRPNQAGHYEIPPIEAAFYDVTSRKYKKVFAAPIPIMVRRGAEITEKQLIGNTNRPAAQKETFDLRKQVPAPIRTDNSGSIPAGLFGDYRLAAVAGAGPLLYLATVLSGFIRRTSIKMRSLRKRNSAACRACSALRKIARHPAAPPQTAAMICNILRNYLSERLEYDAASLTPDETSALLQKKNVTAEPAENFRALYEKYFNAVFAGAQVSGDIQSDCKKMAELIKRIENEFRKKH